MVVGVIGLAIDLREWLWDYCDQQIHHHHLGVDQTCDKEYERCQRLNSLFESAWISISKTCLECINHLIPIGRSVNKLSWWVTVFWESKEGLAKSEVDN